MKNALAISALAGVAGLPVMPGALTYGGRYRPSTKRKRPTNRKHVKRLARRSRVAQIKKGCYRR